MNGNWRINTKRSIILLVIGLLVSPVVQGRRLETRYTLNDIVAMALSNSSAAKNADNTRLTAFWRFRNYKTMFRPQLNLDGDLPDFYSANTPVRQPDGTLQFRHVNLSESSLNLYLNQEIAATGTKLFLATDFNRIDDFDAKTVAYQGSPFKIGFKQTLLGFNPSKWRKKIEPLRWDESQKAFFEDRENIAFRATNLFFRLLSSQTSVELAQSNMKNSEANLAIADVKKEMGKITANEYKRVALLVLNAKKALSKSEMSKRVAEFNLKSFVGINTAAELKLSAPLSISNFKVDAVKALEQAKQNRADIESIKRQMIESERDLEESKRSNGLRIALSGTYGLTNTGKKAGDLMRNPEVQKMVKLSFNVPVLDWGRSSSKVKMAEANQELVKYKMGQVMINFEREVIVQVEEFNLLYDQVNIAKQADEVAEGSYNVALQQYQNGNLSITDFNISLQEREQSRTDFIDALKSYWLGYYNIRRLTLFDFENSEPIFKSGE